MEKKSYINVNNIYEIPIENLSWAGIGGRQYELQSNIMGKDA